MKLGKFLYRGTIAVDIDGVLADFEKQFCEDFGEDNRHLYSLEARYPQIDPEIIREYVANPDVYKNLVPIFGGPLFTKQAHSRGWYILLVTSRDRKLREVTKTWLSRYYVTYNELLFAKNKAEAIADYDAINSSRKVKIVVDDSVSVLKSMLDKYCVAWKQPWNSDYYPTIWYSHNDMKLLMNDSPNNYPVGVWDLVGKNEKS